MEQLLYSRRDAARMLGNLSVRQLDYLIELRRLVPTYIGRRPFLHIEQLRRFAGGNHPDLTPLA